MKKFFAALLLSGLLAAPAFAQEDLPPKAAALKEKAAKGDGASAYELAVCYHFGKECPQSDADAAKWLEVAANKGDADAIVNLGDFYHQGLGVKQDDLIALQWYRAAAGHGSAEGEFNIGRVYAEGYGVKPDLTQAKAWYLRAANQGLAEAQMELGRVFMQENDFLNAYYWYGVAAKTNDAKAVAFRDRIGTTLSADQVAAQQKKIAAFHAASEASGWDQRRAGDAGLK